MNQSTKGRRCGFFQDDHGNYSSIRLMSFIALIKAIVAGYLAIAKDSNIGVEICLLFLLAAFVPKSLQKVTEKMPNKILVKNKNIDNLQ